MIEVNDSYVNTNNYLTIVQGKEPVRYRTPLDSDLKMYLLSFIGKMEILLQAEKRFEIYTDGITPHHVDMYTYMQIFAYMCSLPKVNYWLHETIYNWALARKVQIEDSRTYNKKLLPEICYSQPAALKCVPIYKSIIKTLKTDLITRIYADSKIPFGTKIHAIPIYANDWRQELVYTKEKQRMQNLDISVKDMKKVIANIAEILEWKTAHRRGKFTVDDYVHGCYNIPKVKAWIEEFLRVHGGKPGRKDTLRLIRRRLEQRLINRTQEIVKNKKQRDWGILQQEIEYINSCV